MVLYVILFFFSDNFRWLDEIYTVVGYILIFWFSYALAVAFGGSFDVDSSPFFLASSLNKDIRLFFKNIELIEDKGIFKVEITYLNDQLIKSYTPIEDPDEYVHKADALIFVLYKINTRSSKRTVDKLEKIKALANLMKNHKTETFFEIMKRA